MDHQIRRMKPEDFEASIALSQFAFQYELEGDALEWRRSTFDPNTAWGIFEGERLAAKLHLFPYRTWINGRTFEMGGIAGVATRPEYRRQGYVRSLLRHALEQMKEQGQTLSMLHPFAFGFYRKFGWETFIAFKKYEIEMSRVPKLPDSGGEWERSPQPADDWAAFHEIYEQYARRYNGMMARTETWWRESVLHGFSGQAYLYRNAEGRATGYIHYKIEKREMDIEEIVFLDEPTRAAMWSFIRNHDSMADTIKLQAPIDDELSLLFDEPRFKQEVYPYFMARIADVAAFLRRYPFAPSPSGRTRRFKLRVDDPFADWNDRVWGVEVHANGQASAEPCDEDCDLRCDIQTLTATMLGYTSVTAAAARGKLDGDPEAIAAWSDAVPRRTTYLYDFF